LNLQNIVVDDLTADVSGEAIPMGIPISPGASVEVKGTQGAEVDISFGKVTDMDTQIDPKTVNPELGRIVAETAQAIVNAAHTKPCLTVDGQPLTITRTFELQEATTAQAEFGFKILYSAGFKAIRSTDAKNTITVKLLMHGTQTVQF
jgi:hypothetical protein